MISFEKIGEVLSKIRALMDFVIIGDTIVDLELNKKATESDVDLFSTSMSVFFEEDKIREFTYNNGWDFGKTPFDTPRLIVPVDDNQLQVDLYENIQDFYVPQDIINNAEPRRIGHEKFRVIKLEDYILLKANAFREEDEDELRTIAYLVGEGKLKINKEYLSSHINLFEENSGSIKDRLNSVGIKLSL
ncbi:MAG: nucleotidyltransferase, partial [Sulfolobus sp.]|nr:nucleotidyltransferase [Sulfolobus sp.]